MVCPKTHDIGEKADCKAPAPHRTAASAKLNLPSASHSPAAPIRFSPPINVSPILPIAPSRNQGCVGCSIRIEALSLVISSVIWMISSSVAPASIISCISASVTHSLACACGISENPCDCGLGAILCIGLWTGLCIGVGARGCLVGVVGNKPPPVGADGLFSPLIKLFTEDCAGFVIPEKSKRLNQFAILFFVTKSLYSV